MNTMSTISTKRIAVIGGGAAGMMAAGTALLYGADVTVYEHKDRPMRKLRITGKGRCNLTNNCTVEEFITNVIHNSRFMYAPLAALSPEDTMALFENLGVPLKTERGRRVFPVSDSAEDILKALLRYTEGVHMRYEHVKALWIENDTLLGVEAATRERFDAVILATGGRSYPLTGSDGSGYSIAARAGHTVTPLSPSLVPIVSKDPLCPMLQGLSLRNVSLKILESASGRKLYEDFGEMMFTHFGLTGPMILSASAHLEGHMLRDLVAEIDLKPALDEAALDARILSDFKACANRNFENALKGLLPAKMIPAMIQYTDIPADKKVHDISKAERLRLLGALKHFKIPLHDFRPIEEAIVTAGGVSVSEIDPKTMMSKKQSALFLAGEILDLDAYTGGYNLQIAFSTGYLAGKSAAEFIYS